MKRNDIFLSAFVLLAAALLVLAMGYRPNFGTEHLPAESPAQCESDMDCAQQFGGSGSPAQTWSDESDLGPGDECTEDMDCWCVAHGLDVSRCTTD